MLRLSIQDIKQGYVGVKALAKEAVAAGQYDEALSYIRHCATLAQQFNWIYADDELERLLQIIGQRTVQPTSQSYSSLKNRVVFYDDFCVSFILALQYLEALVYANYEVLYITIDQQSGKFSSIIPIIQNKYPQIKIMNISNANPVHLINDVYKEIISFRPQKVLLHAFAHTFIVPAIYELPEQIDTYLINLADQTFWLGSRAVDYVFEFRQFGVSVSQQCRGFLPEQQLLIPFYPIADGNKFQGFPKECIANEKVTIFSGGDIYKVLDDKRMYWHLVKSILDSFPEVVFLFATKGDGLGMDFLDNFIRENRYEGRFIYTKFRSDINEVLAHTDIYMGTCPASGSLMSQLAARNATPILQYYYPGTPDDETEQAICVNEEFQISFRDEKAFMHEAEKLIHNVDYRKKQGERLQKAMIKESQFNQLVKNTLDANATQIKLKPYDINYALLEDRWFALEKAGFISSMNYIYGLLGFKTCLRYAPILLCKKIYNKISARINVKR